MGLIALIKAKCLNRKRIRMNVAKNNLSSIPGTQVMGAGWVLDGSCEELVVQASYPLSISPENFARIGFICIIICSTHSGFGLLCGFASCFLFRLSHCNALFLFMWGRLSDWNFDAWDKSSMAEDGGGWSRVMMVLSGLDLRIWLVSISPRLPTGSQSVCAMKPEVRITVVVLCTFVETYLHCQRFF